MPKESNNFENFKAVLKQLFEMDKSDLDFGIFRIINTKRNEIDDFINNKLPASISSDLANTEAENDVYAHLTQFFSRYYEEGDFIAKRRYSKNGAYALPYNGEETVFYWANFEQFYIKNSENLKDYRFKLNDRFYVIFKILTGSTEQNNNLENNSKRRYILLESSPFELSDDHLVVNFEYTLVGNKKQEKLNLETEKIIESASELTDLQTFLFELSPTDKNKKRTVFGKHLSKFTAKNTFDYFIHKDLEKFLSQELDFYVKSDILRLDDIENQTAESQLKAVSLIKTFKKTATAIIKFLSQIEEFQKNLWLKKKFVVESNYCISLDLVPSKYYQKILKNNSQITEWISLYKIDSMFESDCEQSIFEELDATFLEDNPQLYIDTKFFDRNFKYELLSEIEDVQGSTIGTLINSDNYQAIRLIKERYQNEIDTIYIDPPYNTDAAPIMYKNGYRNSSWLTMLSDRVNQSIGLLKPSGVLCATIDDYEQKEFSLLLEQAFGKNSILGTIVIRINPSGRVTLKGLAQSHEYAIFAGRSSSSSISKMKRTEEQNARFSQKDESGSFELRNFRREGSSSDRKDRPKRHFPIYVKGESFRVPKMNWDEESRQYVEIENAIDGEEIVWPVDSSGRERVWRWGLERIDKEKREIFPKINNRGQLNIYYKYRPNLEGITPPTIWVDKKYSATEYGTNELKKLFGNKKSFDFPKSIHAVEDCLDISGMRNRSGVCLDYFAGSGTTGSAVINLNRQDNGDRKFILVEMGQYFENLTKPRILKSLYSDCWKSGCPQNRDTHISGIVEYYRLESYEDTLNNIRLISKNPLIKKWDDKMQSDYQLSYALGQESQGSSSLMNAGDFSSPFNYALQIDNYGEYKEVFIDLVETFNFLLGIKVKKVFTKNGILVLFGEKSDESILIVWQEKTVLNSSDLDHRILDLIDSNKLNKIETIYINGENTLMAARPKGSQWEVKQIEPEFKRLMFANK